MISRPLIKQILLSAFGFFLFCTISAQPYIDIVNSNLQSSSSSYRATPSLKNSMSDAFFNVFLPIKIADSSQVIMRFSSETVITRAKGDSTEERSLFGVAVPLGVNFHKNGSKWTYTALVMPKFAAENGYSWEHQSAQLGGVFLLTRHFSMKFKLKAGLSYNREAFGNFFVPLFGIDWKVNDKLNIFGVLPQSLIFEYRLHSRVYAGIASRFFTRSFRLNTKSDNDYLRFDEIQGKAFVNFVAFKSKKPGIPGVVLFVEGTYLVSKGPLRYFRDTKTLNPAEPLFTAFKACPTLNFGAAVRLRTSP